MNKIIIYSTDVYCDLNLENKKLFINNMNDLISTGNIIVFTATNDNKKSLLKDIELNGETMFFINRDKLRLIIKDKSNESNYFVIVGNRDADLQMAASNKLFYIVPLWCNKFDSLPQKYGVKVDNIDKLRKVLDIIVNQNNWFYRLELDEKTTILSLTNANTFGSHTVEEIEMINGFKKFLKNGNKKYYEVLLYHFLASISNKAEFKNINDWGIFPSSGTELNADIWKFKEKARELMNGRKKEPIFIRHTKVWKSHESRVNGHDRLPCDRHFDTIILNDRYKGKLYGRTVCIFDDYSTYGTSFEAARNLLKKAGASKMFFVSLGKFHKSTPSQYYQQNFNISGDVFDRNYGYEFINGQWHSGNFDYSAVEEIERLHDIMFL
jgi:hypothetical protein